MSERTTPRQQQLLDVLQRHGEMTCGELAERVRESLRAINGPLNALKRRGLVLVDELGHLMLPPRTRALDLLNDEDEHERRRLLWQKRGIVVLALTDLDDGHLAERLRSVAVQFFGPRRTGA